MYLIYPSKAPHEESSLTLFRAVDSRMALSTPTRTHRCSLTPVKLVACAGALRLYAGLGRLPPVRPLGHFREMGLTQGKVGTKEHKRTAMRWYQALLMRM